MPTRQVRHEARGRQPHRPLSLLEIIVQTPQSPDGCEHTAAPPSTAEQHTARRLLQTGWWERSCQAEAHGAVLPGDSARHARSWTAGWQPPAVSGTYQICQVCWLHNMQLDSASKQSGVATTPALQTAALQAGWCEPAAGRGAWGGVPGSSVDSEPNHSQRAVPF